MDRLRLDRQGLSVQQASRQLCHCHGCLWQLQLPAYFPRHVAVSDDQRSSLGPDPRRQ